MVFLVVLSRIMSDDSGGNFGRLLLLKMDNSAKKQNKKKNKKPKIKQKKKKQKTKKQTNKQKTTKCLSLTQTMF